MKGVPPLATFANWTERLKVYNTYISTLAKYKHETARAERVRAERTGAAEVVRAKKFVIKELQTHIRLLHKVVGQHDREAALVAQRERRALQLLSGGRITGSLASAWTAYWWFETHALLEAGAEVEAVRLPKAARDAECFFDNRDELRPCEAAPATIHTGTGLATWMHRMNYLPRAGSAAQSALVDLFRVINGVAAQSVAELHAAIASMQAGAYNAWNPRVVLGVTPSAIAARIECAGASRCTEIPAAGARRVPKPHHRPQRAGRMGPALKAGTARSQ